MTQKIRPEHRRRPPFVESTRMSVQTISDYDEDLKSLLEDSETDSIPASGCFSKRVIRVPSRYITITTVSLPLGAFLFAVLWAYHEDYRSATLVYCKEMQVFNYLPSLSSAIGDFHRSKVLWILCVTIHAPSRYFYARMYYKYLTKIIYRRCHPWVLAAVALNVIEITGLLGLSYISSKTSLPWHSFYFAVFIIASELYMVMICVLLKWYRNIPCVADREMMSLQWKVRLIVVILVCSLLLPYFYQRHNARCEEGVYTIFALLEYIVVLCNMAFHCTASWDFYDVIFSIPIRKYLPL